MRGKSSMRLEYGDTRPAPRDQNPRMLAAANAVMPGDSDC